MRFALGSNIFPLPYPPPLRGSGRRQAFREKIIRAVRYCFAPRAARLASVRSRSALSLMKPSASRWS
ncbi:MAG: hypothetical protein FD139_199 [Methylocystaceae bacterium]|nr:MAG: hypothetical protein FD148_2519 [Methylocystaceae bacterium]KAF0212662.1 MAG: hypothetical protein FD172_981 [Methylocystaceae bacterium]TXT48277.1 MAG: hypothetical protein FD139_199 [Methylocystaceae bacterium]